MKEIFVHSYVVNYNEKKNNEENWEKSQKEINSIGIIFYFLKLSFNDREVVMLSSLEFSLPLYQKHLEKSKREMTNIFTCMWYMYL